MRFEIEVKGATDENFDAVDFMHDATEILSAFWVWDISIERIKE